jgi:hypothetical protein
MVKLKEVLYYHSHQVFIMFIFVDFFTFIFPFEAQQSYAWTTLGTYNMYCFTLLRLLHVCRWILVFILFLAIDTCCVKVWKVAHWIFVRKEDGFTNSIMFIFKLFIWVLHCFVVLLLFYCFLLVHFLLII